MKPSEFSILLNGLYPDLTTPQIEKLCQLKELYQFWNDKINVISRKDMDNFFIHHVLHSLSIYKIISFRPDSFILDVGTGGGFPGVPLAIVNKDTSFHLIDSIGKKIKVVKELCNELKVENVLAEQKRAENTKGNFDFVISRAVTRFSKFCPWVVDKIKEDSKHHLKNGIIYLKGGDLKDELNAIKQKYHHSIYHLKDYFEHDFFETKQIVHLHKK